LGTSCIEVDVGDSEHEPVAVLLRFVEYEEVGPEDCVSVKGVFTSESQAQDEANRLNALPQAGSRLVRYFVKLGMIDEHGAR